MAFNKRTNTVKASVKKAVNTPKESQEISDNADK